VNLSDNREGWDEERSISHCDHGGAIGENLLMVEERPPHSCFILRGTRLYLSNLMGLFLALCSQQGFDLPWTYGRKIDRWRLNEGRNLCISIAS